MARVSFFAFFFFFWGGGADRTPKTVGSLSNTWRGTQKKRPGRSCTREPHLIWSVLRGMCALVVGSPLATFANRPKLTREGGPVRSKISWLPFHSFRLSRTLYFYPIKGKVPN